MSNSKSKNTNIELDLILNYIDASKGLSARVNESGKVQVKQNIDGKKMSFYSYDVSEVLSRTDSEGKGFLQVNFKSTQKILLTDTLVGFKPHESIGLDMTRLPKVVTTPDLKSVYEAIEESLGGDDSGDGELEILKKVYFSILTGAEKVGFELEFEKKWHNRLAASRIQAAA